MADAIAQFFTAWSMTDAQARTAAIAAAMAPGCTYADPRSGGVLTGHAAISDYVAAFSANAPGWTAKVVLSDETAHMVRATVAFAGPGPDGADMQQLGQYFATFTDNMITTMTGFVGTGTPQ